MIRFKAKAGDAPTARSDKAVKMATGSVSEGSKPAADAGATCQPKAKPARKVAGGSSAAAKSKKASKAGPDQLDLGTDSAS